MKLQRFKIRESIKQVKQEIGAEAAKAKALADSLRVMHFSPKVAAVAEQIFKVIPDGWKRQIRCPYCRKLNIEGNPLCCDLLRAAIVEVLEKQPETVAVN